MSRCLYIVRVEVEPRAADGWLAWQRDHHMPEVLQQPGFVSGRRYRASAAAADGWVRFVNVYTLESRAALDAYAASEASRRLKQDHTDRFGKVTRVEREIWEEA